MKKVVLSLSLLLISFLANAQIKVLFDASKAQMAGNADWVVDADLYNIGTGSGGAMVTGSGNEANPQRIPTNAQSGITATTAETYWKGGLSNWAVDLVRRGFTIETLPFNGQITYGVATNSQDLTNYKVFIVCEPNIPFTAAQKTAMMNFVQNGGGLFVIGNHNGSDRNSDGWDSPRVWNDFFNVNPVRANPFGFTFDAVSFSQTTTNIRSLTINPILKGPAGNVTGLKYDSGNSMTLNRTANSTVLGLIYKTGASTTGTANAMFVTSNYGSGRICGIADSSPSDDGTGDNNDVLYSSYRTSVSGSHQRLFINSVLWLAGTTSFAAPLLQEQPASSERLSDPTAGWTVFPVPAHDRLYIHANGFEGKVTLRFNDLLGRNVANYDVTLENGRYELELDHTVLQKGIYLLALQCADKHKLVRVIID